jgi:large subunit ribosomal protein L17
MRHKKQGRQFGRNTSHRRAMFRALTANLVLHERIETTDAKAKELRRVAERLLSQAIRLGNVAFTPGEKLSPADKARRLAAQRQVGRFLQRFGVSDNGKESRKVDLIEKVFVDLAKRFQGRAGGYTRIIKLGPRRGDNAPMCLIEFVQQGASAGSDPAEEPAT